MSLVDQCSFVGLEGGDDLRNVDLERDTSYRATSRKYSHSVGSCFNAAGQPPSLLPSAGVMRRPQKANSPLSVANGKGERL